MKIGRLAERPDVVFFPTKLLIDSEPLFAAKHKESALVIDNDAKAKELAGERQKEDDEHGLFNVGCHSPSVRILSVLEEQHLPKEIYTDPREHRSKKYRIRSHQHQLGRNRGSVRLAHCVPVIVYLRVGSGVNKEPGKEHLNRSCGAEW